MFASVLPQAVGLLPKWQLLVATMAGFNTVQNFLTLKLTHRLYSGVPPQTVTGLQARTFAIWTLLSAVVRAYCAYHIHDKSVYDLTLISYLLAFGHFVSEIFIFKTAKFAGAAISPCIVSTVSLVWMMSQYGYYIKIS